VPTLALLRRRPPGDLHRRRRSPFLTRSKPLPRPVEATIALTVLVTDGVDASALTVLVTWSRGRPSSLRAGPGGEAAVALTVLVTDGVDASALTVLVTGKTNIPTKSPLLLPLPVS
jgi:hypothetical protein